MIINHRALNPDVEPQQLIGRDGELTAISEAIDPDLMAPRPVFIFGPSGAGKTTVATFALEQAERELAGIRTAHVECSGQRRAGVLRDAVRKLVGPLPVTPTKGADLLLDELREHDGRLLVVLDEVDRLREKDVLEDIYRLENCTMICIANREAEFFSEVEEIQTLHSRLSVRETIHFSKYSHERLVEIVDQRAARGLRDEAITPDAIETIADAAAGDARRAIAILQTAARQAAEQSLEQIDPTLVANNVDRASSAARERVVSTLTGDIRVVYDVVADADSDGWLKKSEIDEAYRTRAENPVSDRTVVTYLGKLIEYDVLERRGRGPATRYRITEPI